MSVKAKINGTEFAALGSDVQGKYEKVGDGNLAVYYYTGEIEDVAGLKAKRDELLGQVTTLKETARKFADLDPEKAKAALAKLKQIKEEELLSKEDYTTLIQTKTKEHETALAKSQAAADSYRDSFIRNEIKLKLIAAGALPDRVDLALTEILPKIDGKLDDSGALMLELNTNGIKDASDFNGLIEKTKEARPFLFDSKAGSGGGAVGGGGGGDVGVISQEDFTKGDNIEDVASGKVVVK